MAKLTISDSPMPTPTRPSRQHLAETIAATNSTLREMENALREEERKEREARYIAVGKVVEACGLLNLDPGELETILKRGIAARERQAGEDRENDKREIQFLCEKRVPRGRDQAPWPSDISKSRTIA